LLKCKLDSADIRAGSNNRRSKFLTKVSGQLAISQSVC